ncbi:MAG: HEAT repeat domain-containing protein [Caldilineaceae bacterium]
MMIQTVAEAIAVLDQPAGSSTEREDAIHFLHNHPSPEGAERLVAALSDDDTGVRWAAAQGLIDYGERALPPLLRALAQNAGNSNLRIGAYQVLHDNPNASIREQMVELIKALRGPGADVASMQAASKLYLSMAK